MPNKQLGQHWLKDRRVLQDIANLADITTDDTVLEIGPGLGTLTSVLLARAYKVMAIEYDTELARKLPGQFPGKNLEVVNTDFLTYDLSSLPAGYKVVANVPYYITSKIIERLMTANNRPSRLVLLVQKEVAERIGAKPGDMSILAIATQVFAEVSLGPVVDATYFTPPPKVDSQVIILNMREAPLIAPEDEKAFFRIVKAGFREKRKKLRSSISAGLAISKPAAVELLNYANIDADKRAEQLTLDEWIRLARISV